MKCSNITCGNQFDQPANVLGECATCHAKHAQRINGGAMRFATSMCDWIAAVEARHGKTIFYSDEFAKQDKRAFTVGTDQIEASLKKENAQRQKVYPVKPETVQALKVANAHLQKAPGAGGLVVSSMPSEMITMLTWNGMADGFVGASKNFYLMSGRAPSDAIRAFVLGRVTVCECEGIAMAVYLNSICDLVGDKVFDILFKRLSMVGTSAARHNKPYIDKLPTPGVDSIQVGDWIYYVHETLSLEKFQDLARNNRKGGAASGWNLVCVEGAGARARFVGFGMSNNKQGMTLTQIKDTMIKECGGEPSAPQWKMYVSFRIRLNTHGLAQMVQQALTAPANQ